MTTRCHFCRAECDNDDDDELPVCSGCSENDDQLLGDRDIADADFQLSTADPRAAARINGEAL